MNLKWRGIYGHDIENVGLLGRVVSVTNLVKLVVQKQKPKEQKRGPVSKGLLALIFSLKLKIKFRVSGFSL